MKKIKKYLTALVALNTIFFTAPTIVPKTEAAGFVKKQNLSYNLEAIMITNFDDKSFEAIAEIAQYQGYDKYNQYLLNYDYKTDEYGKFAYEKVEVDNETFKKEKAPPVFSMFGAVEPAKDEKFVITKFADGSFSYTDLVDGVCLGEYHGKFIGSGVQQWEVKSKTQEIQKKFETFKKLMNIEDKIKESTGFNNYDLIMAINPKVITKRAPNNYYSDTVYSWWDFQNHDWSVSYERTKNTLHISRGTPDSISLNIRLEYSNEKTARIDIVKNFLNKSSLEKDKYIKDIYTPEQINEMFEHIDQIIKTIKEEVKDLPHVDTPPHYGHSGGIGGE